MGKLYLVRHGRATEPGDLRLPGADVALLEQGWAQARALAERLWPLRPAAVYSSGATRTRQTGAVVAERCGVRLTVLPALREIDFGAWGGRTFTEIVAEQPAAAGYFADPAAQAPPSGEHVETVARRVLDALRMVSGAHRESAVVVGHAGSLRLALARELGMPLAAYWRLRLDYASLSALEWTEHGVIVEGLNDVSHLPTCNQPTWDGPA